MIYDPMLKKGVKKKVLPEPNPTRVELPKLSTLQAVFSKATELYFSDLDDEIDKFILSLSDSSGIPIHVADSDTWVLIDFYRHNGLQPSRYKLYVTIDLRLVS